MKNVLEKFDKEIEKKKLEIKLNFIDDDIRMNTDRNAVEKIVYNLISNAIKFTDKGSVEIVTERIGSENKNLLLKIQELECRMSIRNICLRLLVKNQ